MTAVTNIPLVAFLIYTVVTNVGAPYAEVRAYLAQPLVTILLLALVISAAIHMRIGLKEIIEDYVHGSMKVVAILLATFFAAGVGLASAVALLRISLGS
jgi:succinate dehydrogenase / fumarate reductase membrane anchor subunit